MKLPSELVPESSIIMDLNKRINSVENIVGKIKNGSTIMISGFGEAGVPNRLLGSLKKLGPTDLTIIVNSVTRSHSLPHALIEANMVSKVITTSARGRGFGLSTFEKKLRDGEIELECIPQGNFAERIRAGGAGIPAFYTPVGFGTVLAEGKETRRLNGKECILEKSIVSDFALIRGDQADKYGNINFSYTQMNFAPIMAAASKTTIAEVREILVTPMEHMQIQLPSVYVDHVFATGESA